MKLHIKNMVCARCKAAVKAILTEQGLQPLDVQLGEVEMAINTLEDGRKEALRTALAAGGFELADDRAGKTIALIKALVVEWIHHSAEGPRQKWSELISASLHQDYSALSKLFSETEGITIEQYIIQQKTERVKELMVYDELSLSQIADELGYSSLAHLSAQFKKATGMTPTAFKALSENRRKPLDEVGRTE